MLESGGGKTLLILIELRELIRSATLEKCTHETIAKILHWIDLKIEKEKTGYTTKSVRV